MKPRLSYLFLAACLLGLPATIHAEDKQAWWSAEVAKALDLAGDNRKELVKALTDAPADQRKGMAFLVANMPNGDLKNLKADFLLENLKLAYKARNETAWGKTVPEEIFLNDVLPYANVDESRDPWRKEMYELCVPLVKDCKTLGEAAHQLNANIFTKLKVKYSTERKLPNQSPKESIEQGKASCTGLSVILSDACRSVGIPARLVGTPLWANKRSNHTWVEIWDGRWHFTGACEADPKGLDRGWFVGDASQALKDSRLHAIYATSFRKTETSFPLVWAPNRKDVFAENVTDHYTTKLESPKEGHAKIMVRVWQEGKKGRLAVPLTILDKDSGKEVAHGESRGDKEDTNNITTFELLKNHEYLLRVGKPMRLEQSLKTTREEQKIIEIELQAKVEKEPLNEIEKAASAYFSASPEKQAAWKFDPKLDAELSAREEGARQAVWKAYQAAPIHDARKKDFDEHQVRFEKYLSAYVVREVGKRPANGWPLFIAMHGGGNAPKSVNDSQWKQMQTYYRDQKDVTGYKYLALRAPNDTWNGFYDTYVPPLIYNLIRQFALFGDIDTDKVFIMGYSHGGYGAFYIGPKIPDHFAAIHCSASAPTDGSISPLTLRNTRFTFMVGENDTAYGRRERCEKFDALVKKLKDENKVEGEFPIDFEFKKGIGHGGLPDRDKIKEMYPHTRNCVPRHLTWELTDNVVKDFFWISVPNPTAGASVDVRLLDNAATISTKGVTKFSLCLDGRLVDMSKPLQVTLDGKKQEVKLQPSFLTLCQSIVSRGDPKLAYTCRVDL